MKSHEPSCPDIHPTSGSVFQSSWQPNVNNVFYQWNGMKGRVQLLCYFFGKNLLGLHFLFFPFLQAGMQNCSPQGLTIPPRAGLLQMWGQEDVRLETTTCRRLASGESPAGCKLKRRIWLLCGGWKRDKVEAWRPVRRLLEPSSNTDVGLQSKVVQRTSTFQKHLGRKMDRSFG